MGDSSSDSALYAQLPDYSLFDTLSVERVEEIIWNIKQNSASCTPFAIQHFPKMGPWCRHIQQMNTDKPFNITKELIEQPYDDFLLDLPRLASTIHVLMIVIAFVTFIGFIGNILCLPWLNSLGNRTGATLYMTVAAVCDITYLVLFWLLYAAQILHGDIKSQVEMYVSWSTEIIPVGAPLMTFCLVMSTWLLVALLIDRLPLAAQTVSPQAELSLDDEAKAAVYRKRSRCRYTLYMSLMAFFFALYAAVQYMEFQKGTQVNGQVGLMGLLAAQQWYQLAMGKVLRPTLELILPSVLIVWYLVLIRSKKFSLKQRYVEPGRPAAPPDLTFVECRRWRNEASVSRMSINAALVYLVNMLVQTMAYFVQQDQKAGRQLRQIFRYLALFTGVFVVCLKPIIYLLTSKAVLREFQALQKAASPASTHNRANAHLHPGVSWRSVRSSSSDGERILA